MNTTVKEEHLLKSSLVKLNDKYSIRVVNNLPEFETLRETWDTLAYTQKAYFPFLCFDWFKIWIKHFLNNNRLLIALVYKEKEIVFMAPFTVKEERYKGINVVKIGLIGNIYSPIKYIFFNEMDYQEKEEILQTVFKFFATDYTKWDIIDLDCIPTEDDRYILLKNAIQKTYFKFSEYICFSNCYINNINYSSDMYIKSLSKNFRSSIRKNTKKAQDFGNLSFNMIVSNADIDNHIKMYFEVYAKSWKQRERIGTEFYIDLLKMLAKKGWLRLGFLFLNGMPIATGFAITCDGIAYFEKTAYDENFADIGAGKIWHVEMMKYLIDVDKVTGIDLLRGEYGYKKNWAPMCRERKGIVVFDKSIKGLYLTFLIKKVLPVLNKNKYLRKTKEIIKKLPLNRFSN